ncbi:MAG: TRAP transporter small permease subunit [Azospirillaceae bacterium]
MTRILLDSRGFLDRMTRWVAIVGFCALVAVSVLTMVDGTSRYIGLPRITGFTDMGQVFFAVIIACCFPIGLLRNQNVTITFVGKALGRRGNAVLNFFGALITFAFFVFVAYQFFVYTIDVTETGRTTRTILMPVAPWWWVTSAIILTTVPVQLWVLLARLAEIRDPDRTFVFEHIDEGAGHAEEGVVASDPIDFSAVAEPPPADREQRQ